MTNLISFFRLPIWTEENAPQARTHKIWHLMEYKWRKVCLMLGIQSEDSFSHILHFLPLSMWPPPLLLLLLLPLVSTQCANLVLPSHFSFYSNTSFYVQILFDFKATTKADLPHITYAVDDINEYTMLLFNLVAIGFAAAIDMALKCKVNLNTERA